MDSPFNVTRIAIHMSHYTALMQADEQGASRDRSAALFGNRFFADVVVAVERLSGPDDALVTTRRVASATALSDSLVRPVMLRLRTAGLITDLPREGGSRSTLHYQVQRGPIWEGVLAACAATIAEPAPDAER
jgi:hypothetical protein